MVDQLAFFLIKPDAVISGRAPALLERLEGLGLRFLDLKLHPSAHARAYEELYKENIAAGHRGDRASTDWWLSGQVYAMGPTISILAAAPDHAPWWQTLKGAKGPSDPFLGVPGQIRFDIGANNRALNLLHSSDDSHAAAREFAIFNGEAALPAVLARSARGAEPIDPRKMLHGQFVARAAIDVDAFRLLVRCKVALLWAICGRAVLSAKDGELAEIYQEYERVGAADDTVARYATLWALGASERRALRGLRLEADEAVRVLHDLCAPDIWSYDLAQRLIAALVRFGVKTSDWDRLLINTGLFFAGSAFADPARAQPNFHNHAAP